MSGNGFSSIKNLDALTEAGFSDQQARAILQTMGQDAATKADLEYATAELKQEIKNLDLKIETVRKDLDLKIEAMRADLKRDIKELDNKIEAIRADLKRDIKEMGLKMNLKMALNSGAIVLTIVSVLVTLGKLGILAPTPPISAPIEQVRPFPQK